MSAPERIYLDGDLDADDFPFIRGAWLDVKYVNEPPLVYVRADRIATLEAALADMTQQRDAAMAGAVKVKPLVFSPWSGGGCMGSPQPFQFFITQMQDQNGDFLCHWDSSTYKTLDEAKAHAQACYLPPDPDRLLALTAAAEAQAEARGMRKAGEVADKFDGYGIPAVFWPHEISRTILALADATEAAAKGGV